MGISFAFINFFPVILSCIHVHATISENSWTVFACRTTFEWVSLKVKYDVWYKDSVNMRKKYHGSYIL